MHTNLHYSERLDQRDCRSNNSEFQSDGNIDPAKSNNISAKFG